MKRSTVILLATAVAAALTTLAANSWWPGLFPAIAHIFDCKPSTVMWVVGIVLWAFLHSGAMDGAANKAAIDKD